MSIFTKIIQREIPARIEYEQENIIVIHDINPEARIHLLIIPKKEIPSINDLEEEDRELIAEMFFVAKKVAQNLGVDSWYKLLFNVGSLAEIDHLHLHLLSDI